MTIVDLTPQRVTLRAYQGDPFDLRITLTVNGGPPPDLSGWNWAAQIVSPTGQEIAFETTPEPDGVRLYLRGAATQQLRNRSWLFDVTGRDPDAGEGRTILRGNIAAIARITPPLELIEAVEAIYDDDSPDS